MQVESTRYSKDFQRITYILGVFYFLLFPIESNAEVIDTLQNFLGYLTGDLAKTVAAIALVGAGFMCFVMGSLSKTWVISIVTGIALVFGGKALVSTIVGV